MDCDVRRPMTGDEFAGLVARWHLPSRLVEDLTGKRRGTINRWRTFGGRDLPWLAGAQMRSLEAALDRIREIGRGEDL